MKLTVSIAAPTTRIDGSALAAWEVASLEAFVSLDNGANFSPVQINGGQIVVDGLDPGTNGIVRARATDTQNPPRTSDFAVVNFSVPVPVVVLAQPSPPTLGTPVIS